MSRWGSFNWDQLVSFDFIIDNETVKQELYLKENLEIHPNRDHNLKIAPSLASVHKYLQLEL